MAKIKKMKKAVFALPSLVTLSSVFCAFLSMAWSFQAQAQSGQERLDTMMYAALAIIGSIVFDTFDGKVARATHTSTRFGMELDSLADAVSFGVAPAILVFGFALTDAGWFGIIAAFVFAAGAILRLARFNVEAPPEGVQTFFKGIPAPGGAACMAAIVMGAINSPRYLEHGFTNLTPFEMNTIGCIAIAVGLLMVSTVKYKTMKGKKTVGDYIFVGVGLSLFAALCFILDPATAFFFLVVYYVTYGLLYTVVWNLKHMKPHRRRRRRNSASMTNMPAVASTPAIEAVGKDKQATNESLDNAVDKSATQPVEETKSGEEKTISHA